MNNDHLLAFRFFLQNEQSLRGSQQEQHDPTLRDLQGFDPFQNTETTLVAWMGDYPGYTGPLNPNCDIRIIFQDNGMMEIKMFTFLGMESSVTEAGFHIHEGTSCDDASQIGGHRWNSDKVINLWNVEHGAYYSTLPHGKPVGGFHTYNGYRVEENVGYVVVAHAVDGERVACGVLEYLNPPANP